MEIKTWEQLGFWLGMQFPVVAIVLFTAQRIVAYFDRRQAAELARSDADHKAMLALKDEQIATRDQQIAELKADRDRQIAKLEAERDRWRELRLPTWNPARKDEGRDT